MVIVEMCPLPEESSGGIVLPWRVSAQTRTDVGVVVSAGGRFDGSINFRKGWTDPSAELSAGDYVLVVHDHGKRVEEFGVCETRPGCETRFYGVQGGRWSEWAAERLRFEESILAKLVDGETMPLGSNVKVRLSEQKGFLERVGGKVYDPVCEVVAIGGRVCDVQIGDRVVVNVPSLTVVDDSEFAFVPETEIYGVVA